MFPISADVFVPALTAIATGLATYLVTKSNNRKELAINHRRSLSEDEKAFRQELKDIIASYKIDLDDARREIRSLSNEVEQLHKINLELTLENKRLQVKVDELRDELQLFNRGK